MTRWVMPGLAIGAVAAAVTACTPPHPHHPPKTALKSIAALSCPASQGDLTRTLISPDGKSCQYAGPGGAEVTLALVAVDGGDVPGALAPLETSLRAELPAVSDADKDGDWDSKNGGSKDAGAKGSDKDRVDIDLPGIHIHADGKDDGGGNHVQIGKSVSISNGKTVVTDNKPGGAGVTVDAHDKGAEIHVSEPGGGVRQSFILASDNPGPHGYRLASYEARGPVGGPIVVASVLAKTNDQDDFRHDLGDLLKLNVGG